MLLSKLYVSLWGDSTELALEEALKANCVDAAACTIEEAKAACDLEPLCKAIVCPTGQTTGCTLRAFTNLADHAPDDCYIKGMRCDMWMLRLKGRVSSVVLTPAPPPEKWVSKWGGGPRGPQPKMH